MGIGLRPSGAISSCADSRGPVRPAARWAPGRGDTVHRRLPGELGPSGPRGQVRESAAAAGRAATSRRRELRARRGPATDRRTSRCRPTRSPGWRPPRAGVAANVPEASGTRGSCAPPSGLRSPRSGASWSHSEGTAARRGESSIHKRLASEVGPRSRRHAEVTRPRVSAGLCRQGQGGRTVPPRTVRAPLHPVDSPD